MKKRANKLVLVKETLQSLEGKRLAQVGGGVTNEGYSVCYCGNTYERTCTSPGTTLRSLCYCQE